MKIVIKRAIRNTNKEVSSFYQTFMLWGFVFLSTLYSSGYPYAEASKNMRAIVVMITVLTMLVNGIYYISRDGDVDFLYWGINQVVCVFSLWLAHIGHITFASSLSDIFGPIIAELITGAVFSFILLVPINAMIEDIWFSARE